jgi:hypothetical protein
LDCRHVCKTCAFHDAIQADLAPAGAGYTSHPHLHNSYIPHPSHPFLCDHLSIWQQVQTMRSLRDLVTSCHVQHYLPLPIKVRQFSRSAVRDLGLFIQCSVIYVASVCRNVAVSIFRVMAFGSGVEHLNGKGKAIPLQALTGPEGSRRLRLPDFKTIGTWRWQGCQPQAPAAFTPRKYSWYSFTLEAESTPLP